MKKICFIVDNIYSLGGIQKIVTELSNKLVDKYKITIINQYNKKNKRIYDYKLDKKINVLTIDNNFFFIDKIIFFPFRLLRFIILKLKINNSFSNRIMSFDYKIIKRRRFIRFFNKEKFDYILAEGFNNCFYMAKIKDYMNSKIIGCWHSSYFNYYNLYNEKDIIYSLKRINTFVLTKYDAFLIKEKYNIDVNYIYNFIDSKKIETADLSNKTFVAVGRYNSIKGYDRLIDIYNDFFNYNKEWKLYIVGDGPEHDKLQKLIDINNLSNNIILTGGTNNVEKYYKKSSVFLMTSYGEGFPMVILEAMKFGLPIIAYDIPVLHEILPNNKYIVEQNDKRQFVNLMVNLSKSEELRKKIGYKNMIKCRDFYDTIIVKKWLDILK